MQRLTLIAALVVVKAAEPTWPGKAFDPTDIASDPDFAKFTEFIKVHRNGVHYRDEVETMARFSIFKKTLARVKELNSHGRSETYGVNRFADLSEQEFKARYLKTNPSKANPLLKMKMRDHKNRGNLTASSIDWREKGAVTDVQDQGQCGSCWAYSATEQLESDYFLKYGKLLSLSQQQLVSCDSQCAGCEGGWPATALLYIHQACGQMTTNGYPYTSGSTSQDGTCYFDKSSAAATVSANVGYYISLQNPEHETNMREQIMYSPMSVAVDASLWQYYEKGVMTASSNCGTSINHAVQVVGLNAADSSTPYWIVKNTWGTSWGDSGYIYIAYGSNNCGITYAALVSDPTTVS
jgi:C1A family cysteine protease